MDPFEDERFKHIVKDPRFRNAPVHKQKITIDKRFQSMFTDNKFKLNYKVDIRGRPIHQTSGGDLKKFYRIVDDDNKSDEQKEREEDESSESQSEEGEKSDGYDSDFEGEEEEEEDDTSEGVSESHSVKSTVKEKQSTHKSNEAGEGSDKTALKVKRDLKAERLQDEIVQKAMSDKIKERLHDISVDYARGVGLINSESSSDESSSSEDEEVCHPWGELDADAAEAAEETKRLAICHMDWDRVTAKDLMVLIHSFLPPTAMICSVTIYPSEFGIQRMKEEEMKGPRELTDEVVEYKSEDDREDDGDDIPWSRMEKLREYQLNRLKYYYAVAEFDTAASASKFYSDCDRMEYESSATHLDLRFIPDDMTFDQEPKEVCDKLPDLTKYQPRLFCNTALQQGRVNLTWEEPDPDRVDLTKKLAAGVEVDESTIKSYVAMSSEEDDEQESKKVASDSSEGDQKPDFSEKAKSKGKKNEIMKYRSLLNELQTKKDNKKGDVEMEITWDLGLQRRTEQLKEKEKMDQLTPFEQMMAKRREKKKTGHKKKSDTLFSDDELPSDVDLESSYHEEEHQTSNKKGGKTGKKKGKQFDTQPIDSDEERRKADLALILAEDDDDEEGKSHFSLKKIQQREAKENKKSKWKKKDSTPLEEDNFQIDLKDERFNALFTSHHYHIDPTAAQYRKTKGSEQIIVEKQKRRRQEEDSGEINKKKARHKPINPDINKLIANVKKNTKNK